VQGRNCLTQFYVSGWSGAIVLYRISPPWFECCAGGWEWDADGSWLSGQQWSSSGAAASRDNR
jgi:hypothetical protein